MRPHAEICRIHRRGHTAATSAESTPALPSFCLLRPTKRWRRRDRLPTTRLLPQRCPPRARVCRPAPRRERPGRRRRARRVRRRPDHHRPRDRPPQTCAPTRSSTRRRASPTCWAPSWRAPRTGTPSCARSRRGRSPRRSTRTTSLPRALRGATPEITIRDVKSLARAPARAPADRPGRERPPRHRQHPCARQQRVRRGQQGPPLVLRELEASLAGLDPGAAAARSRRVA